MGEGLLIVAIGGTAWVLCRLFNRLGWLDEVPDTPEALFNCPDCGHDSHDEQCGTIDDLGGWVSDQCQCRSTYHAVP